MPKRTLGATLDLHGYRKSEAIRAVTDFLEQQAKAEHMNGTSSSSFTTTNNSSCSWVSIITGSGSHSQDGPVLRTAVDQLLRKRQMEYTRNTPSSFLVNPNSGIVFTVQPVEDTKLIIIPNDGGNNSMIQLVNRQSAAALDGQVVVNHDKYITSFPMKPQQVMADDGTMEHAKHASRSELLLQKRQKVQEDIQLKQVLMSSRQEHAILHGVALQEEQQLQQVLHQSSRESSQHDLEFMHALEQSKVSILDNDDEYELQEALQASKLKQQEDEEKEALFLRQALEQSLLEL